MRFKPYIKELYTYHEQVESCMSEDVINDKNYLVVKIHAVRAQE